MDNVSSKFCNNLGYINCIQVCNRSANTPDVTDKEYTYELALACESGLYFGTVTGTEFELNPTEFYFGNLTVSQVIEISPGIIMCSVFEQSGLQIIRRANKRKYLVNSEEIELINCSDLLRLPEYNYDTFPYIIVRSKHNISLVNVRSRIVYNLIHEQKPNFDNEFSAITPNGKIEEGGSVNIIFSSTK